ncbi:hypothetical protein [Micromonospora sp. NPDC092111]|uniref:hypothetical protein n=1 Tax=Micromonospora sp. NPDC092111 TaxID=3364289 RepID=UPI0038171CEB
MRRNHLALLGAAVLALAVPAGCGRLGGEPAATDRPGATSTELPVADEPTAAPTTAALPDACALVPKADAEQVAGTPLEDAVPVRDTCSYTAPVSGPTAQVEVYVGDGAKKMLDIDRELGHDFTTLTGIGDEAYLEDGAAFFAKSGVWVAIRLVRLNDPAENRTPMEALARAAAGRM